MARQILTRVAEIIKEVNRTSHKWSSHKISNFRVIQEVSRVIEVVVDGEVEAASVEVFLEVARTDSVGLLKHLTRDAKTLTAPSTTRLALTGLATKITSSSNSRSRTSHFKTSSGCSPARVIKWRNSPTKVSSLREVEDHASVNTEKTVAITN